MEAPESRGLSAGILFAGRYEVLRPLKEGGMGAIYEVRHVETDARCALKVMLPGKAADEGLRERFRQEWRLTANIQGDHIVRGFDAGFDQATQTPYLVMEILQGEDLGMCIAKRGRMRVEEVLPLLEQLAQALERIHAAGVVHRDIKPGNLFLAKHDDGSPRLVVLDFGVAKIVVESTKTIDRTIIAGSPPYMPPEQLDGDGDIGTAADTYAFGHVAYTLLVGTSYWHDEYKAGGVSALRQLVRRGLPEPASKRAARQGVALPSAFDAWFEKVTSLDPDDRMDSPTVLAGNLARALAATASTVVASPAASIVSEPRSRVPSAKSWWSTLAAVALFVIVGVVAAGIVLPQRRDVDPAKPLASAAPAVSVVSLDGSARFIGAAVAGSELPLAAPAASRPTATGRQDASPAATASATAKHPVTTSARAQVPPAAAKSSVPPAEVNASDNTGWVQ